MSTGVEQRITTAIATEMAEVEPRLNELVSEAVTWNLKVGRLHLRGPIGPQLLFVMFVSFHLIVGVGGALLLLRASGRAADLGLALVVGALFGFGAFVPQVVVEGAGRLDRVFRTPHEARSRAEAERLFDRCETLAQEMEALSR